MQKQQKLLASRRSFLTRSGLAVSGLAVASACGDDLSGQLPINASWEEIASRLERSNGIGTADEPIGRATGQIATHVPIVYYFRKHGTNRKSSSTSDAARSLDQSLIRQKPRWYCLRYARIPWSRYWCT